MSKDRLEGGLSVIRMAVLCGAITLAIISAMPKWTPTPGCIATYTGRSGSGRRNMLVVAEAIGGRFVVQAIGRKGILVRLTVKRDSLVQPQPDLFAN